MVLLSPITSRWYILGLGLDVVSYDLESLQSSSMSNEIKLSKVLQMWMETSESHLITWKTIISVIEGPLINNRSLAESIYDFLSKGKFFHMNQCLHSLHALWLYNN